MTELRLDPGAWGFRFRIVFGRTCFLGRLLYAPEFSTCCPLHAQRLEHGCSRSAVSLKLRNQVPLFLAHCQPHKMHPESLVYSFLLLWKVLVMRLMLFIRKFFFITVSQSDVSPFSPGLTQDLIFVLLIYGSKPQTNPLTPEPSPFQYLLLLLTWVGFLKQISFLCWKPTNLFPFFSNASSSLGKPGRVFMTGCLAYFAVSSHPSSAQL